MPYPGQRAACYQQVFPCDTRRASSELLYVQWRKWHGFLLQSCSTSRRQKLLQYLYQFTQPEAAAEVLRRHPLQAGWLLRQQTCRGRHRLVNPLVVVGTPLADCLRRLDAAMQLTKRSAAAAQYNIIACTAMAAQCGPTWTGRHLAGATLQIVPTESMRTARPCLHVLPEVAACAGSCGKVRVLATAG